MAISLRNVALFSTLLPCVISAQPACPTTSTVIRLEQRLDSEHYFTVELASGGTLYLRGAAVVDFWEGVGDPAIAKLMSSFLPLQEDRRLPGDLHPIQTRKMSADLVEDGRAALSVDGAFLKEVEMERVFPPCGYARRFKETGPEGAYLFEYTDALLSSD